ncbi:hypothetical protein YUWDRAFT_06522 [Streptomyces sp. AmelKG-D3]|nr:hypothetical protein YUWDRAFT_06522 [Streptomyces sp. AmelKG-D3]
MCGAAARIPRKTPSWLMAIWRHGECYGGVPRFFGRDVQCGVEGALSEFLGESGALFVQDVSEHDLGALLDQAFRVRLSLAAGDAGDEDGSAVQTVHGCLINVGDRL